MIMHGKTVLGCRRGVGVEYVGVPAPVWSSNTLSL